jgi:hypothetical protein
VDKHARDEYIRHLKEAGRLLNDAAYQPLDVEQIRAIVALAFEHVVAAARALEREPKGKHGNRR